MHHVTLAMLVLSFAYFEVSPIELLPEIPHGLKFPEFGKGKAGSVFDTSRSLIFFELAWRTNFRKSLRFWRLVGDL